MDASTLQNLTVIYDLIEARRAADNWCGETHIQKTTYFLEHLTGHALGYDYILYKHGPYSFGLSENLSAMKSLSFVDEEIPHPGYGPRFKHNPEVAHMLRTNFGEKSRGLSGPLTFVVGKLGDYGVATLERLGTALYFTRQEPVRNGQERAQRIHQVKPHISVVLALHAVTAVDRIVGEWEQQPRLNLAPGH